MTAATRWLRTAAGIFILPAPAPLAGTGPEVKNRNTPISGVQDILVLKLNSAGVYQWHTFYGSARNNDTASSLAIDNNGNVYVAGESFNAGWQGDTGANPINPSAAAGKSLS